jgi:predicted transcriptional regulator
MKYRDRVDIIAAILNVAGNGAKKTKIMYIANLSYTLLKKYLEEIVGMRFMRFNGDGYGVTEKGRLFLERYAEFSTKYSKLESELELMRFEREVLERMCESRVIGPKLIATRKHKK